MDFSVEGPFYNAAEACEPVLRALPDWFGVEEANRQYLADLAHQPAFLASEGGQAIGFLALKMHFAHAAEIAVMGVLPNMHRGGVGRALLAAAQDYLRRQGVEFLQVKTLSDSHPDPFYARTRAFYQAVGFRPLEEFKTLWDASNPCLMLVKKL